MKEKLLLIVLDILVDICGFIFFFVDDMTEIIIKIIKIFIHIITFIFLLPLILLMLLIKRIL
jgi:hypothetical protein